MKVDGAKPNITSDESTDSMKKLEGNRYHSPHVQTTVGVIDDLESLPSTTFSDTFSLEIASGICAYNNSGAE